MADPLPLSTDPLRDTITRGGPPVAARVKGVVLAGGAARRMGGGDKSLRRLGGRPVLAHVLARLGPQTAGMALNANGDPARFDTFALPVIPDDLPDLPGPLAGVLAGLDWAAAVGATHIVTAAADTPFFPLDLSERLWAAAEAAHAPLACAATADPDGAVRDHPTFGLWSVALRADLREAISVAGVRKIIAWTDRHGCARAVFDGRDANPFFNINTPEDLAAAEADPRAGTTP